MVCDMEKIAEESKNAGKKRTANNLPVPVLAEPHTKIGDGVTATVTGEARVAPKNMPPVNEYAGTRGGQNPSSELPAFLSSLANPTPLKRYRRKKSLKETDPEKYAQMLEEHRTVVRHRDIDKCGTAWRPPTWFAEFSRRLDLAAYYFWNRPDRPWRKRMAEMGDADKPGTREQGGVMRAIIRSEATSNTKRKTLRAVRADLELDEEIARWSEAA